MANEKSGASGDDALNKVRKAGDRKNSAVRRVAQAADTGEKRDRALSTRLGFPALIGLIVILGLALNIYAWSTREGIARPAQGDDHWHAVYGVWDCTQNGGDGGYLPSFQSTIDEEGIHSHQDGIIHIHPWFDSSDGPDAQLNKFLDSMQVELNDDSMSLEGRLLSEGTMCNTADGEQAEAVLKVHRWQFWFEALEDETPEIFTENLDSVAFENDREVYIISFAPENAEIPIPPQARFDQLEQVAPIVQSVGPQSAETQTFNVPETGNPEDTGG